MNWSNPFGTQSEASWLDPTLGDQPIPVFKPLTQIISENALAIGILALLLFTVLLTWFYLRKRSASPVEQVAPPPVDPYQEALDNIAELQERKPGLKKNLSYSGFPRSSGLYRKAFQSPAMELTSEEFMREIVSSFFFSKPLRGSSSRIRGTGRPRQVFQELMGQDEMNQLLNTALHIVEDTHMRLEEEKCKALPANATNPK